MISSVKGTMVKSIGLFITGALLTFSQASGTTVSTTPTGYFPVTIAAGTSAGRTLSFVSFPLQNVAPINGEAQGFVTGVTSNTITNSNAGWTAGQLSTAATPCLVQFTSGAAAGRTFLVSTSTSNTATTLTLDAVDATTVDLTTLGIVPGTDTYQILSGDTLSTLFGTPATTGIAGATSSGSADQVELLSNGVWLSYYYNTNSGWLRVGPPIVSANVVNPPRYGCDLFPAGSIGVKHSAGWLHSHFATTSDRGQFGCQCSVGQFSDQRAPAGEQYSRHSGMGQRTGQHGGSGATLYKFGMDILL